MADEEELQQNLPEGEEPEDHQDFKPDLPAFDDPKFAAEVAAGEKDAEGDA